MLDLSLIIQQFFNDLKHNPLLLDDIYNEFSLQHELGIFLRNILIEKYDLKYKVQFERNIADFYGKQAVQHFVKREMDIVIISQDKSEKYAIELKFPRNGQYPEQMYSFIKDLCFMEQVKQLGFNGTYCVCLVDNKNFYYSVQPGVGIYQYFRPPFNSIHGKIHKPTGDTCHVMTVSGTYRVNWQQLYQPLGCDEYQYYLLEMV